MRPLTRISASLACAAVLVTAQPAHADTQLSGDRRRAVAAYAALQGRFYSKATHLYADSPAGSNEASAAAWSFSQAFAATLALARLPEAPGRYRRDVADRWHASAAYWDAGAQPPAYAATVTPHGGADVAHFYDDNEWLGFDLLATSRVLRRPEALEQAERVFTVVRAAWDGNPTDTCPGGVFWTHWHGIADRNTVSTANGALLALRLYQVTGTRLYLEWAERMYAWVTNCLTRPDGLIADHIRGDGTIDEHAWTYNQGAMVASGALLYAVTGDPRFLSLARTLAVRAVAHFADFRGEPPIFVAIFFRDLRAAGAIGKSSRGRSALQAYADQAWNRDRLDPSSALFTFRRPPTILDQAAMVQIYATLAGSR